MDSSEVSQKTNGKANRPNGLPAQLVTVDQAWLTATNDLMQGPVVVPAPGGGQGR